MSLILNQEAAGSIPNPVAGKGTVFMNTSDQLSVKSNSGVVSTFPTILGSNTQVFFNDAGTLNGNANLVFDKTTGITTGFRINATANITTPQLISNVATGTAPLVVTSTTTVANLAVATATTAGTVTTAAQGNITSVGTLTSLGVTGTTTSGNFATAGNITASFLVSNIATGTAPLTVTSTTRVANLNVNYANVSDFINVTAPGTGTGYIVFANATTGNVAEWTTAGISSNLANNSITATTFVGALSGAATSATTAGTVTTAAQPNITSTGTLTSLGVTGNITAGNINTSGTETATRFISNIATGTAPFTVTSTTQVANLSVATAGSATTAGTVTTAAQPNITSTGTLSSLTVTGNISGGNISTGGQLSVTGTTTANGVILPPWNTGAIDVSSVGGGSATTGRTLLGWNRSAGGGEFSIITNRNGGTTGGVKFYEWANTSSNTTTEIFSVTATGAVTTPSTIGATGNVSGGNITTAGRLVSSIATGTAPLTVTSTTRVANLSVDYSNVSDFITVAAGTGNNFLIFANAATGNISELTSTGLIANLSNNSITATTFVGALSGAATTAGTVTTAAQGNITSVGTLTGLGVNGTVTAVNITANTGVFTGNANGISSVQAGNIVGTTLGATVVTSSLTTVGTLGSLTVTGNVTGGNLVTAGVLSVTGTGVSSIGGNLDMTSNTIINLATPTNSTDAATKQYVDDVAQGLNIHDSCNAATQTTLATISGGTITYNNGTAGVGATLTTTGTYTTIDGVTLADGMRILVKNEATAANNGIYVRTSATVLTRAADFNTPAEMEGGDFTFITAGTLYDNTGWVMTDPVTTVGTSPVTWVQFSGAGTYTAGTGLTLTGTTFSVNVAQTQITSVGTLTGLGVNGTITGVNITANTGVFTGNANGLSSLQAGNLTGTVAQARLANSTLTLGNTTLTLGGTTTTVAGLTNITSTQLTSNVATGTAPLVVSSTTQVANLSVATAGSATTAGTVTTAAQGNITSVGTLTSLTVTGNVSGGNITTAGAVVASTLTSNIATGTAPLTVTSTTRVANLNVNYANVSDFISVAAGTGNNFIIFANAATGNVTELTSTGLIANLSNNSITATTFVGALSGAATTAGTVTTAAQPNITSTGTLTSLTVSGAANIQSTTAATSRTTGALIVAGGIGSNANSFFTNLNVTSNIAYVAPNGANTINSQMLNGGTLAWSGNAGQLFSITDSLTGNIFSVNDVSGIPMIAVDAGGNIYFAASGGFVAYGSSTGITAAGSTQATATALTRPINVVSTVSASTGVILPATVAGMRIIVMNTSGTALNVYPATGGAINAIATNGAYSLAAGARLEFVSVTTTQWYTLNATYA